jgi:hypothetical protein
MCEHCSDGSVIWASIARLAAYAKLSERYVTRLLHELSSRGILTELAPANTSKRKPTTWRINEDALEEDPLVARYRSSQQTLPGIRRPPIPGEPIPHHAEMLPQNLVLVNPVHQSGDPSSPVLLNPVHQSSELGSPDPKAFDSKSFFDPKPLIQKLEREKNEKSLSFELDLHARREVLQQQKVDLLKRRKLEVQ